MRHYALFQCRTDLVVSIHASVKDATDIKGGNFTLFFGFNPRICKRCDRMQEFFRNAARSFNPRICKRCDSMFVKNFIDDTFKL